MKLLSSIRTPKKVTLHISTEKHEDKLDKDGEAGEVSSIGQPPELQEPTSSSIQLCLGDVGRSKFQFHSLTQTIFGNSPNSTCHVGHTTHFE